jgi:two-component system, cell cycle response regulator DivK
LINFSLLLACLPNLVGGFFFDRMEDILKGKHILVVEDEESNWFLIRDILECFQVITTWAEVGQKALDLVKSGEYFDAILMDIHLPSMDGIETTRRIKSIRKDLPVIAQTAFTMNSEIEKCYKAGCDSHVCKPFTVNDLKNVLIKVLTES